MDFVDGTIMDLGTKRDAIINAIDQFIAHVKGTHEQIIHTREQMEADQRLAATEKARLQTEIERSRKELDQLGIQIRAACKELEKTHKQNELDKQEIRRIFDSIRIKGEAVA
jgi:hypothetical protein